VRRPPPSTTDPWTSHSTRRSGGFADARLGRRRRARPGRGARPVRGRRGDRPDEDDDEDEDGPDLLRVRMTADAARSFVARATGSSGAGRPPCPLCGAPLDPQGHICPRRNGQLRQLVGRDP
jgi:hypothetical protein